MAKLVDVGRESRQGRPTIAHRFIGGNPSGKKGQVPSGTKEIVVIPRRLLSSLTGLVPAGGVTPALKRWAIFGRPAGLKNESAHAGGYEQGMLFLSSAGSAAAAVRHTPGTPPSAQSRVRQ